MEDQVQFATKYFTEIIMGASSLFVLAFRHRLILGFLFKICAKIYGWGKSFGQYIMLPLKLSKQQIVDAEKSSKIEATLNDLSEFIKQKLSYNGGSSLVDAIKRIEHRQIILEHSQSAFMLDTEEGLFRCDISGKNLWVNRTYARFLGCGTNELLGLGWKKFIKTPELTRYNGVWQTAFADGCEFEDVVEFTDVNHHTIHLKISASIIPDDKGGVIGYIGQVTAL